MLKKDATPSGIPISISLEETLAPGESKTKNNTDKKRLLFISLL